MQGTGETTAGVKLDGVLARDLQVRSDARFGHFLQPLPSRTLLLGSYANAYRRRLLRYSNISQSTKRCVRLFNNGTCRRFTGVFLACHQPYLSDLREVVGSPSGMALQNLRHFMCPHGQASLCESAA